MPHAIAGLKPQLVWKYFAEISKIPRLPGNEEKIVAYVLETAKKLGLSAKKDKVGNIVVKKPASTGSEDVRSIVLQCHLDMDSQNNADKGIGVATNLSVMENRELVHGPLEFLFTVDEEGGLTGAKNLSPGFIKSKTLLNIDAEEEGSIFVGCAGGKDTVAAWKMHDEPVPSGFTGLHVTVKGLRGGHSGLEIDKNHGNAIKILNRVVMHLADLGARLSSMDGGNKRNAIPREAEAVVYLPKKKMKEALDILKEMRLMMREENASVEPDLRIEMHPLPKKGKRKVLKERLQSELCHTIAALPHGVIKMSSDIPGLVETSTNLAVVSISKKKILLGTSQRSSVASELEDIQFAVSIVMKFGGAKVESTEGYPAWKPKLDSVVLQVAKATYQELFKKEPEVKTTHAGLECGVIGEKYRGMDMIAFGPTVADVHSVERFYKFLLALLAKH